MKLCDIPGFKDGTKVRRSHWTSKSFPKYIYYDKESGYFIHNKGYDTYVPMEAILFDETWEVYTEDN